MERYICIHGHFYQPPRENPWLEDVEIQDSAYPYHDWNERVTSECYAPNSASRIVDRDGRILDIVSNYARISFNFGPALLAWIEHHDPDIYKAILDADILSRELRSGHGNALAQVYNHIIMPLATRRDKQTQVQWGIRDFQRRFGRLPEGMWLAETAVDLETLDVLSEAGMRFTILAPHQAARIAEIGSETWVEVGNGHFHANQPYLCRLPTGRDITLFFYDGPLSRAIAFENLLDHGEQFAERLATGFSEDQIRPQILSLATDGESYGHHHRHGDMALAYAINYLEHNDLVRLTNYGEYLESHPATQEVQIIENSSWSCQHGIERWRDNCGCNSGANPDWNQAWRAPLRAALDWLRDELAGLFEKKGVELFHDPWQARNDYIEVVLDRSPENVDAFLARHVVREAREGEITTILKLLEMQRHTLLMYTSCGWFFDELSGLETVQVIQYAGRAVQLARELFGDDIEGSFLKRIAEAKSNIPDHRDGALIYDKFVRPTMIDLIRVGAHYAISSLFEKYPEKSALFSYEINNEDSRIISAGQSRLAIGRVAVSSVVTRESDRFTYCVLHFGGHAINGGLGSFDGEEGYRTILEEVIKPFEDGDFPEVIRLMDINFGTHNYSLRELFRDEQRRILREIIGDMFTEFEEGYTALFDNYRLLMGFVRETGMPVPRRFLATAEIALNLKLAKSLSSSVLQSEEIEELIREMKAWNVPAETLDLEFLVRRKIEEAMDVFQKNPADEKLLTKARDLVAVSIILPAEVNLWRTQNYYFSITESQYDKYLGRAREGDEDAGRWVDKFKELGELLWFKTISILPGSAAG